MRAGVGGLDAALFCRDLAGAYLRFCTRVGLHAETLWSSETERGGIREIVLRVTGADVLKNFQPEAGVHRVQRVPETERAGRRQTSTVAVSVLGEPEEPWRVLAEGEVRIETFRGHGPGGQHRNKTETAIRATHLPSGLTATICSERSQHQNKQRALAVLAGRLEAASAVAGEQRDSLARLAQTGLAARGTHIRNYCGWRNEATDVRLPGVKAPLDRFLGGGIELLHAGGTA